MKKQVEITKEDFRDPVYFQVAYLNQTPHKKQVEVLRSKNKNKVVVCGRRSGKTQMVAGELIRGSILDLYRKQIVIGPQYKHVIIVFNKILELMQRAKVYDMDISKVVRSPYPQIHFKNGAQIDFGSADNPNSLRGEGYHRVFRDESAFIKEEAKHAIKPLTYDFGGPIWDTTTPWGKGDVWELWDRGKRGDEDYGCFHYNFRDNPYLAEDGIKEIEKDIAEYGEDSLYVQQEIYGNFVEDRDRYFKKEEIENCLEEYNLPELPKIRCSYYNGTDIAGEGEDETVSISVLGQDGHVRVVAITNLEKNKPREVVELFMQGYEIYKYSKGCTDKTGIGEGPSNWIQEELKKIGASESIIEPIRFSTESKMDMYSNLKKLMNQGKLKFPPHKKLVYQLLDLRYELVSSGQMKIHHSGNKHDDYPDALALACWAAKEEEYALTGRRIF